MATCELFKRSTISFPFVAHCSAKIFAWIENKQKKTKPFDQILAITLFSVKFNSLTKSFCNAWSLIKWYADWRNIYSNISISCLRSSNDKPKAVSNLFNSSRVKIVSFYQRQNDFFSSIGSKMSRTCRPAFSAIRWSNRLNFASSNELICSRLVRILQKKIFNKNKKRDTSNRFVILVDTICEYRIWHISMFWK